MPQTLTLPLSKATCRLRLPVRCMPTPCKKELGCRTIRCACHILCGDFWPVRYRPLFVAEIRPSAHINLKELMAFLRLKERLGNRMVRVRLAAALDSQVCLGALVKGRASSGSINKFLRRSLAVYLGCGLQPGLGYFESKDNPVHDRTRGQPSRAPCKPLWWMLVACGDPQPLVQWLHSAPVLARRVWLSPRAACQTSLHKNAIPPG